MLIARFSPWSLLAQPISAPPKMFPSGLWRHCSRCRRSCWLPVWCHPLQLLAVRRLWRWRRRVARLAREAGRPERSPSCTERPAAKTSASPCR